MALPFPGAQPHRQPPGSPVGPAPVADRSPRWSTAAPLSLACCSSSLSLLAQHRRRPDQDATAQLLGGGVTFLLSCHTTPAAGTRAILRESGVTRRTVGYRNSPEDGQGREGGTS